MGVAAEGEIDGGSEEEKWSTAVAGEEGDHWPYLNTGYRETAALLNLLLLVSRTRSSFQYVKK